MLEPVERLEAGVKSKQHRPWAYGLLALVAINIVAVMYFFPSISLLLAFACVFSLAAVFILYVLFAIVNEIIWIIAKKRF